MNIQISPMVKNLLILNAAMYVGTVFLAPGLYDTMALWFVENPNFRIWQPLTHMFMHSAYDISHILFNMLWLFFLGPEIERWMGSNRFLFFYLSCGLGAFVLVAGIEYVQYQMAINELLAQDWSMSAIAQGYADKRLIHPNVQDYWTPSVGASGAIFGVMAAFMYLFPNRSMYLLFIPFPIKVKYLIGFYILRELLASTGVIASTPGTGHLAHLGGAIVGFIMIWYWKRNDMDRYRID
ncbi:rhomboid family intramembrane serine protease [Nonlabens xiamenensis]|uniref:rhomboid family intramembrane serine protease n=1 Tax=Nonlabens xiamenensis TaxID=2341043 RepID=UPI000F60DEEE|nr:rhomboid family intramembrane serine protease [Nonlabens xiamenensis]